MLVPDPEQAPIVAGAFELAADPSLPLAEVYRRAKRLGLRVGHSRFFELLRNPVYVGKVELVTWRDEPAETVVATHEPIVEERVYARAQFRIENPRTSGQRAPRPEFPLRGKLLCLTAGSPSPRTARPAEAARATPTTRATAATASRSGARRGSRSATVPATSTGPSARTSATSSSRRSSRRFTGLSARRTRGRARPLTSAAPGTSANRFRRRKSGGPAPRTSSWTATSRPTRSPA